MEWVIAALFVVSSGLWYVGKLEHDRRVEEVAAAQAAERQARTDADNLRLQLAEHDAKPTNNVTSQQYADLQANKCAHCGGTHAIVCPRLKRIRFRPAGEPLEVEFWETWDTSRVVYLEDLTVVDGNTQAVPEPAQDAQPVQGTVVGA